MGIFEYGYSFEGEAGAGEEGEADFLDVDFAAEGFFESGLNAGAISVSVDVGSGDAG